MTKLVKIILVEDDTYGDGYDDPYQKVTGTITDWDEISDDDYEVLLENKTLWADTLRNKYGWGLCPRILLKPEEPITEIIQTVHDLIADAKLKVKEQEDQRRREKEKKAAIDKKRQEEKDRKLFEKLKAKLGEV